MIVTGPVLARFMFDQIGLPIAPDTRYLGLQRKDLSIAGAVAYNCWLEDSCFMHVAFDSHGATREFLREAFMYPFDSCRKARVYGMTPITSLRALRLSQRLGFKPIVDTPDFRLQVMSRDECRWINDDASTNSRHSASPASC